MQLRTAPANDMVACYALGAQVYMKGRAQTTVDALDYAHVYTDLVAKFPYLKRLCDIITTFLQS